MTRPTQLVLMEGVRTPFFAIVGLVKVFLESIFGKHFRRPINMIVVIKGFTTARVANTAQLNREPFSRLLPRGFPRV